MTDVDAPTYDNTSTEKCLSKHEHAKKKKYLQACVSQRMNFTPLVFSVDGAMGKETEAFIKRLAKHLSIKWDRPFLRIIYYILTGLRIAFVQATHQTMQGFRIPVKATSHTLPIFEDGAGMPLMF